jgi:hypothetical protein
VSASILAQENSPYTRFGIGDMRPMTTAAMRGWGNMQATYSSKDRFNIANPASLGALKLTNYQIGLFAKGMTVRSDSASQNFGYGTVDYITLAFPIKHGAVSFGLLPLSRVNYNILEFNESANGLPRYVQIFNGEGSVNEAYLATGVSLFKNLRIGARAAFVFGNIRNATRLVFDDTLNGFNSRYYNDRHLNGFSFYGGAQYDIKWKEQNTLTVGVAGNLNNSIRSTRDMMMNRFYYNSANAEVAFDTITAAFNQRGAVILPASFDAGLLYNFKNKWLVGVNFNYTDAQSYRSFNEIDSFRASYKVAAGIQWIPNETALEGLYNRLKFRLGGYYQQTPIYFNNQQINQYAITAGFGIPVKRFFSDIDFAFEIGKMGTTSNNLLEERFLRGTLGFSISDRWFIKRKYD